MVAEQDFNRGQQDRHLPCQLEAVLADAVQGISDMQAAGASRIVRVWVTPSLAYPEWAAEA